jgi:hypothetical protein
MSMAAFSAVVAFNIYVGHQAASLPLKVTLESFTHRGGLDIHFDGLQCMRMLSQLFCWPLISSEYLGIRSQPHQGNTIVRQRIHVLCVAQQLGALTAHHAGICHA